MGSLALRPGGSLTILLDGFVNRLQDSQSPSFLLFKLRGFELLPRWDCPPLFMPAFAGRTLVVPDPECLLAYSTAENWIPISRCPSKLTRTTQYLPFVCRSGAARQRKYFFGTKSRSDRTARGL
jgi:hypothetical protein